MFRIGGSSSWKSGATLSLSLSLPLRKQKAGPVDPGEMVFPGRVGKGIGVKGSTEDVRQTIVTIDRP